VDKDRVSITTGAMLGIILFAVLLVVGGIGCTHDMPVYGGILHIILKTEYRQGYGPPDPETTVTSYFVHGSSKYGAFTDTDCVESELIEKSLALGEWTVYAIGNNASGEPVASSVSMIVNLVPNEIITIELLCMPV